MQDERFYAAAMAVGRFIVARGATVENGSRYLIYRAPPLLDSRL